MILKERRADIGKFEVGRVLPAREKRQVGPFVFIDHMGPTEISKGRYMDVDQHPHIGLSTLTYLFEGEIEHRDSIGEIQRIQPGDAGFMTAGSGVTHTERTPEERRDGRIYPVHGYQIWIALPKEREEMEARFDYYPAASLPRFSHQHLDIKLIAGDAFGQSSPLKGHSSLFMLMLAVKESTTLNLSDHLSGELGILVVEGSVQSVSEIANEGEMLVCESQEAKEINFRKGSTLMLIGGKAFPEPRYLLWNFVSSDRQRLQKAKIEWQERKFPRVPGDDTYVPFD
jgi:hypothetical protein